MRRLLPLVLCAALAAPALATAQAGFFTPTPNNDPSLTRTLPPENYAPATTAPPAPAAPAASAAPAAPAQPPATGVSAETAAALAAEQTQGVEAQMDRSEAESRDARAAAARAPTPINGAFTGLTDERDR